MFILTLGFHLWLGFQVGRVMVSVRVHIGVWVKFGVRVQARGSGSVGSSLVFNLGFT